MGYPLEDKLVVAVASSALFNLSDSDRVFREKGLEAYEQYQQKNLNKKLRPGVAFPFIKRLLHINSFFPDNKPVEVILLSKNNIDTGLRVFRSISAHNLDITRAAFLSGSSPYKYISAYDTSLFLSGNECDVKDAMRAGCPAGFVLNSKIIDDDKSQELRIAFDFDGVIAGDESEAIYKKEGIEKYHEYEVLYANNPLHIGPLGKLLQKISKIQKLEEQEAKRNKEYTPILRTSIITARNAPAHERVITTLKYHGISVDEAFFMGGVNKATILEVMKPHIFFDDQKLHLKNLKNVPAVHIPFGVANIEAIDNC